MPSRHHSDSLSSERRGWYQLLQAGLTSVAVLMALETSLEEEGTWYFSDPGNQDMVLCNYQSAVSPHP